MTGGGDGESEPFVVRLPGADLPVVGGGCLLLQVARAVLPDGKLGGSWCDGNGGLGAGGGAKQPDDHVTGVAVVGDELVVAAGRQNAVPPGDATSHGPDTAGCRPRRRALVDYRTSAGMTYRSDPRVVRLPL